MALYKAVMNINEDSHRPHGWHGLDGDRCIKRDTPTKVKQFTPPFKIGISHGQEKSNTVEYARPFDEL